MLLDGTVPEERRCTAHARQSGERCRRWASPGKKVCVIHGSRAGRKSNPERYVRAVANNPELEQHFNAVLDEIEELQGVDLTIAGEISLLRALLSAATADRSVDPKLRADMIRDLTRALQKEREIEQSRENLVPMAKVREMLRLTVSTVTRFVPPSSQQECWDDLSRVLQPFNETLEPQPAALPEPGDTDG